MDSTDELVTQGLRQQFQALQEQQQQRRRQRMTLARCGKEKEPEPGPGPGPGPGPADASIRPEEDLGLQLVKAEICSTADISKSLLENENELLQEQIHELRDENGRLYKLLNEKNFELKHLKKKSEDDRLALAGTAGIAGDVAATKIVELSKRNRELTVENESLKSKIKQLGNKLRELEKEPEATQTGSQTVSTKESSGHTNKELSSRIQNSSLSDSLDAKALQEKLTATNLKLIESRNQVLSVKQELKMAHKALANEVGEDVNVQYLLSNKGTWRGRAQQIQILQKKVQELESQMGLNGQKGRLSEHSVEEEMLGISGLRRLSNQDKNVAYIRTLEKERKEALDKMTGDHERLKKDHEELKNKFDGSKARNKVLSSELKILKSQVVTLLEKGKHDDELVGALLKQQKQMQEIMDRLSQHESKNKDTKQILSQQQNCETLKQISVIGELKQMVTEREAKVKDLEEEIKQLLLKQHQEKKLSGDQTPVNLPRCCPSSAQLDDTNGHSTENCLSADTELTGRPLSAQTVSKMGHTLTECATVRPLSGNAIGRCASVNGTDVKTLQIQCTEYKAFYQAAGVERDKLMELVTILQKRLEDNNDKILETEQKLLEQRRWSVTLEQQLGKAKLDAGKTHDKPSNKNKAISSSSSSRQCQSLCGSGDLPPGRPLTSALDIQVEELNTQLAIQMDENEALKTALQSTLKAKEEDLKLYHDTMGQVKQVFLQALRQHKEKT
ncbi:coiled-coil domain-containing protein 13 isoform X2 [Rhincodon typus]|uniref:coiled-coil domain-containing protein 13 isoform X2 n=1 Tax=Rhincodon typus TaxID=259920 RepID=UPI002030848C|nr:coiled-coil domain-containing protein 13 isoform X2 [Rhincodon typus]